MAIVALVLWLFTAVAGFYVLVTSNLGRARPAAAHLGSAAPAAESGPPGAAPSAPAGRRVKQDPWAPPSLVAAQTAPVVPGLRSLLEFMHPACGIIGLGFWFGYTFVHYRVLGWVAVGLAAATASLGLSWAAANARAAARRRLPAEPGSRRHDPDEPAPAFAGRLVAVHGSGAAVTLTLAVLSGLVLQH